MQSLSAIKPLEFNSLISSSAFELSAAAPSVMRRIGTPFASTAKCILQFRPFLKDQFLDSRTLLPPCAYALSRSLRLSQFSFTDNYRLFPNAFISPSTESSMSIFPVSAFGRKISPRSSDLQNLKHRVYKLSIDYLSKFIF